MIRTGSLHLAFAALCVALLPPPAGAGDFTHFESSHVHPLALAADGSRLYAVNTPEARLAIFEVRADGGLDFAGDVPVGLEPVSLATRPESSEVWVVNHLSDTVSVVDTGEGRIVATLAVGDEPTDVAFASGRAFVSLAGKEDRVVVYDAESRERLTSLSILGDDPRAMAVSPDGTRVALVVLESGNRTTNLHSEVVLAGGGAPPSDRPRDPSIPGEAPNEGVIVQFDAASGRWRDETGRDWSDVVAIELPDHDLFMIDAAAPTPVIAATVPSLGTTLFDVAIHPETGDAWVPNTDARNLVRFEPELRGHLVDTRVSIADFATEAVTPVDLNPHVDFSVSPGPPAELALSLAQPGNGVFSSDGRLFYLAAFGSSRVAVLDGASATVLRRLETRGGPSGVALNEAAGRLYVMSRFENAISVLDTDDGVEVASIGVAGPSGFDPSPPEVRDGRRLLYDARTSSGHGEESCATCHLFSNFDGLAWDLGDPQGAFVSYEDADWVAFDPGNPLRPGFDPMKGPIVTQTLRGLRGMEPFHWRGDRQDFQHFNGAFVSLLGRSSPLTDEAMDLFTDFIMTVELPPNPNLALDNSLSESLALPHVTVPVGNAARGFQIFRARVINGARCSRCHSGPEGTRNTLTAGGNQDTKIAHLRNVYEKSGFDPLRLDSLVGNNVGATQLKSGFGVMHDGALSLIEFLTIAFGLPPNDLADVVAFLHSFPTGTFPCVGHQLTLDGAEADDPAAAGVLQTLLAEAGTGRCDVIAKGRIGGADVGYVWDAAQGTFLGDSEREPIALEELAAGDVVTFTGVPIENGRRLGIDRDRDDCLDGDELLSGSDPADPGEKLADSDSDGLADVFDLCPGWVQQDRAQTDSNGDGIPDECTCGDLSGDGWITRKDFIYMVLHQFAGRSFGAIEKCNVAGPQGTAAELCTRQDLYRMRRHLTRGDPLDQACLPLYEAPEPLPMVCADGPS